jgi:hypothetical protein
MRRALLASFTLVGLAAPVTADTVFKPEEGWRMFMVRKGLPGWKATKSRQPYAWFAADDVALDPNDPKKLRAQPAQGISGPILVNRPDGKSANIITDQLHGDIELHLEFMVPKGSNSGVYLQGLYEIQVLDSYGKQPSELKFGDCGGIYARYINDRVVGGTPPPVNASRPPGEWQSFEIHFRAPRFDASGRKTENARFVKVVHNQVTLHENVEVDGPTRAHMDRAESRRGPLMLQGDHGPVAYRNIYWRPLRRRR